MISGTLNPEKIDMKILQVIVVTFSGGVGKWITVCFQLR